MYVPNVIGNVKEFIPKPLFFQLVHADERLQIFALRASVLVLISLMSLNVRKYIQSANRLDQSCMQSLMPASYSFYKKIIKEVKQTQDSRTKLSSSLFT